MKKISLLATCFLFSISAFSQLKESRKRQRENISFKPTVVEPSAEPAPAQAVYICPDCPATDKMIANEDAAKKARAEEAHGIKLSVENEMLILTISALKPGEVTLLVINSEKGDMVLKQSDLKAETKIDVSGYAAGTYLVRLMVGRDPLKYKVVKVK